MSGRHHTPSRTVRLAGGIAAFVLIVGGSFGTGFSVGEAKAPVTKTVVETRVEARVPDACTAALADAVNGLELAGRYDAEMNSLHERDGGIHYFRPGDPGNHYDTAQQHHRELTAARAAFDRAAARCVQEVPS